MVKNSDKIKKIIPVREGLQGATFGVMEGVIVALGILMGLSATNNRLILLVGIITCGLADALGNAAGFHVSEETEEYHTRREVWKSTILCFLSTIIVFVILAIPVLFLALTQAIIVSGLVGMVMLAFLGYFVNRTRAKNEALKTIIEYVLMGALVSLVCYWLGQLVCRISI